MHGKYLFDTDLEDVSALHLKNLTERYLELQAMNEKLLTAVGSTKWQGVCKDKCEDVQKLVGQYADDIGVLCEAMYDSVHEVAKAADDFADKSEKVESIRKV